jgi:predicted CopG family antitoxin
MARPRKVNPDGTTRMISVLVSQETYDQLKAEASERNISFSDLLREILSSVRLAG